MPFVSMPNSGQSLGATRDQIRNNILDIKNSLAVNHVDLDNGADTGKHTMTNFLQISTAADKPTTGATEVALYNDSASTGQIWLCPPNTTQGDKKVQLTAGDVTNVKFATNTTYTTDRNGGWTFLPGGMLLQYGTLTDASMPFTGSMTFPIAFSVAPYSLTFGISRPSGSSANQSFFYDTLTNAGFSFSNTSHNNTPVSWIAIGPA